MQLHSTAQMEQTSRIKGGWLNTWRLLDEHLTLKCVSIFAACCTFHFRLQCINHADEWQFCTDLLYMLAEGA